MHKPLPMPWVESLWARLITAWGRDFLGQYTGQDLESVKADWAERLGGFQVVTDRVREAPAIAYALENLPDRPVNAIQFRRLCLGYTPSPLMLPPPKADPARVAAELAKLSHVRNSATSDGVEWARRIVARHQAGEQVKSATLQWAREALKVAA